MKTSSKLQDALFIYQQYQQMNKKHRRSAVERLASYGYDAHEISKITGVSTNYAVRFTNRGGGFYKFNPSTLDALVLLAVRYEDDETVSGTLARRIVEWGTAVAEIARLCDIPLDVLREAVHNE